MDGIDTVGEIARCIGGYSGICSFSFKILALHL